MMRKIAWVTLCAVFGTVGLANAQTPVDDIQVYDDLGVPQSPFNGLSVTVRGVITLNKGTLNSGTHNIQDATGGIVIFDPGSPPGTAVGDEWEVTTTVGAFGGEIQLNAGATWTFIGSPGTPAPLVLDPQQAVDNDNSGTQTAADYEIIGTLADITGTVSWIGGLPPGNPALGSNGSFNLVGGSPSDTLLVFVDRDTGIDTAAVGDGDPYACQGVMVNFNGIIELKPRFQTDMVENPGNPFPTISNVEPSPWTPETNEAVDVSATITDNGSITSATLFYRDTGGGGFSSVAMGNVGSTYFATIPGTTASGIDYYLSATDDAAQTTTVPGDAPTSVLTLAVGTTSIVTIQSTLNPGTDVSAFGGQLVNVEGIVTMAPGELQDGGGFSQYIIEEPQGGPWSGLFVFEGSGSNVFFRGDKLRISGTINEFSGTTQILPQGPTAVELIDFSLPEPPIDPYSTDELDATEALENVLVRSTMSTITATFNLDDEWTMIDTSSDSTIYVDPQAPVTINGVVGATKIVQGLLDGRFGRNELVPRDDTDVTNFATATEFDGPLAKHAFLQQPWPNPFNPNTKLTFSLPREGLSELAIFDSRGRYVTTLHKGRLDAGEYSFEWQGKDEQGMAVSSGVYYARLRFGATAAQIRKLTLVK